MKSQTYKVLLPILWLLPFYSGDIFSQPRLGKLNHKIHSIKAELKNDKARQQHSQFELEKIELKLATLGKRLQDTNHEIRKLNINIKRLKTKSHQYSNEIARSKKQLASNITAQYTLSNQSQLETLLNQQAIDKALRQLTYLGYLNHQRLDEINKLNKTLQLAQQNLQSLIEASKQKHRLLKQEQHQVRVNLSLKQNRSRLVKSIKNHIANQSQKLHILSQNKKRLEKALARLSMNPQFQSAAGKPFRHLKHHLNWPTKGKFIAKFGTKIDKSQLRWKGVLFSTHMNRPVYAVADGKVIFSRWLPGYGLLIILYHGQGYMTLYGRNHFLYKTTGDYVHAGEQIAAVGNSGGYKHPSLYFAIRHNTTPLNPIKWFKHS